MSRVLVAGNICLDITPKLNITQNVSAIQDVFAPGKLIEIDKTDIHLGGSIANTGLALQKLGVDVKLFGKAGNDSFGDAIRKLLEPYHCAEIHADDQHSTSYSIIWAIPGIDRMICHEPGANHYFYENDIPEMIPEGTVLFHFGYPPLMKSIYQNRGEELVHIFQRMKNKNILTSLDMALVKPDTEAGNVDWPGYLQNVLPLTDLFVPSLEECLLMLHRDLYMKETDGGKKPLDMSKMKAECPLLAKKALQMGCKVVLIKCGAEGLYYRSASNNIDTIANIVPIRITDWAGIEGFQPAFSVKNPVSSTGAGDTCIAAFIAAVLEGKSLRECAALAAAEGAYCVTSYDALSHLQPLKVLEEKIKNGWIAL